MTDTTAIEIRPVHPRMAASAEPLFTLTQAKRLCTYDIPESSLQVMHLPAGTAAGRRLLDRLVRLSTDHDTSHFFLSNPLDPVQLEDLMGELASDPHALRLSVGCIVDEHIGAVMRPDHNGTAIVQIQWYLTRPLSDLGVFKRFSHAGTWNHLRLDGESASSDNFRAIALQPNMAHSWEIAGKTAAAAPVDQVYGRVRALPGRPLWQVIDDPVNRFLLVDRLTKDRAWRLRVADDGEGLYTIGENLEYHFDPPPDLPEGYLDDICAMVADGGTVASTYVRRNLERAYLIGYVTEQGVIVGNSSLKHPRPEYIAWVKNQTGMDLTGYVERGYTSVRPEYRGLGVGTRLLEGLTARAGERKIFSVISEDNTATQIIARRNRTRKVATYFSAKAGKPVGIWMPEWMIPFGSTGGS